MKNIMKNLFYFICMLIFVSAMSIYLFLYTQFGLKTTLKLVTHIIPGHLQIKKVRGAIGDHLLLNNLSYTDDTLTVTIDYFELFWNPLQLLKGNLDINFINLNNIKVTLKPTQNKKSSFNAQWLKHIILKNAAIYNIEVYKDNILYTQINHIIILPDTSDTNQFIMQLKKGVFFGSYSLSDFTDWKIDAIANNIDTNYLWNSSNSNISFHLLAQGDKNSYLNLTNVTGKIYQFPLQANIEISSDTKKTIIKNLNITIGKAYISAQGEAGQKWNLSWSIDIPNLKNIYTALAGSIKSQGTIITNQNTPFVQATIVVNQFGFKNILLQSIRGKIVSSSATKINAIFDANNIKASNNTIPNIHFNSDISIHPNTIDTVSQAFLSKENSAVANLQIPNFINNKVNQITLTGNIKLVFNDLNQLLHISYLKSLRGILTANLQINGPISHLIYNANAEFKNGQFYLPDLGITPHAIQLSASVSNPLLVNITGNMASGRGKASIKGTVDLNKNNFPLQLNIQGNQLEVAHTKEYQITASPDFNFGFAGENASLTGKLMLPYVHIILEHYNPAVELPTEVEFVNKKPRIRYFKNLLIKLDLQLGNEVFLAYQNLNAYLKGKIFVYQTPGGLPTGQGTFIIKDGSYRIYNKSFHIKNGRLIYLGNLLQDPGLNIRAIQETSFPQTNFMGFHLASQNDQMQLGVSVTGTLERPTVEFISNPMMSQDDTLSYILFGQPRNNISGADALSLLGSVASSLNAEGGSSGDDSTDNSSTGIFKMGIMNPIQALNLSLPISQHWRLQTETSIDEVGADILYNYDSNAKSDSVNTK